MYLSQLSHVRVSKLISGNSLGGVLHAVEVPGGFSQMSHQKQQPGERHFDPLNLILGCEMSTGSDVGVHYRDRL